MTKQAAKTQSNSEPQREQPRGHERAAPRQPQDQGICRDQRGQEQPVDKKRAQQNR